MQRHLLPLAVFLSGLLAIAWIAAGYLGSNALALAFTLLIAAGYLAGARELQRYRQATATLDEALADADTTDDLGGWLERLHPSLRTPVRLRIEGERIALPGPALTPYLVGLLVLLGMLGTLLGMMATLRGTGLALESASDLQAMRASLAAPVKGLAFAFGTSIAGVASSAMLGLLSALLRRERVLVAQQLDARIATSLRGHSQTVQREQAFQLMPVLVERLQSMIEAIEQRSVAADERLAARQQAMLAHTEASYAQLAASVAQSLQQGAADSARAATAALQPALETTLATLAREAATLHAGVGQAVDRQLQALDTGFASTSRQVADGWQQLLAGQQQSNDALARELRDTLDGVGHGFAQRSEALVEAMSARLDASSADMAATWQQALARQEASGDALAARNAEALSSASSTFERHATALVDGVANAHVALRSALSEQDRERLAAWSEALAGMGASLRADWQQAGAEVAARQQAICDALAATAATLREELQAAGAGVAGQHQAVIDALAASSAALRTDWAQAGLEVAARQQAICDALAGAAAEIGEQSRLHAGETIAEVSRLVQTAAEAPRAAAEVVAELREKLSDSMVRDTAMLEERNRLVATLQTLLEGVNHAATGQRAAIDSLVGSADTLMRQLGDRFDARIASEAGKLDAAAAQVTASAVEVASLGEAFEAVVGQFAEASASLAGRLAQVEDALGRSLARSDEQLAYYVAQAREVIDLSLLTQRQVIEDLQRLAAQRGADADAGGVETATA